MNAKDIIIEWLKEHSFDGLCLPDEDCGCCINDLIPCDSDPCFCEPGKKRMKDDGDWEIVSARNGIEIYKTGRSKN